MSASARRFYVPILCLLTGVLLVRFVLMLPEAATRRSDGFAAYYTASRLVREQHSVATFYDDEWFNIQVGRFVPGVQDIYRPNTPVAVTLTWPLAIFSYTTARVFWTLVNLTLLAAALALIVRELALSPPLTVAFLALTLWFEPLWVNLRQGQIYIALLFLSVVCWIAFRRAADRTAGIALGLMLVFKTAGVLLPFLMFQRRRWRALAACAATIALVVLASFVTLGIAPWRRYVTALWQGRGEPDLMVTAYQSAYSISHHLFVYDATWNPQPLVRLPAVGAVLTLLVTIGALLLVAFILVRDTTDDLAFAALLIGAIVVSPYSLSYHYSVMLLPIAILASSIERGAEWWRWLPLIAGAVLIAAPLPYLSSRVSDGGMALLGYPKFYGACLLLGSTAWEAFQTPFRGAVLDDTRSRTTLSWSDR